VKIFESIRAPGGFIRRGLLFTSAGVPLQNEGCRRRGGYRNPKQGGRARRLFAFGLTIGATSFLAATASAKADGDVAAGHKKAAQCQNCHGLDGKATIPEAPNLAGQSEIYLLKALGDYKSGARKNEMMSVIAPNSSDGDVADLAAYYSSLPPVSSSR
jgi:cytochrome c553